MRDLHHTVEPPSSPPSSFKEAPRDPRRLHEQLLMLASLYAREMPALRRAVEAARAELHAAEVAAEEARAWARELVRRPLPRA